MQKAKGAKTAIKICPIDSAQAFAHTNQSEPQSTEPIG